VRGLALRTPIPALYTPAAGVMRIQDIKELEFRIPGMQYISI
jgi:hypothetical protein